MLQVSSKNNLYFNIFDYFQYEKFIQIHVGGIFYAQKALKTKAFLLVLRVLSSLFYEYK